MKKIIVYGVMNLLINQGFSQLKPHTDERITDSYLEVIEPEMIKVEGGTFEMGELNKAEDENNSMTAKITLSTFYISKSVVTVKEYKIFAEETGFGMPQAPSWGWNPDHPMVNVDWYFAKAYSDWLSMRTGKKYRLPTEAEWEYAARGGKENAIYTYSGSENLDEVGWYLKNTPKASTEPVMTKKPNALGIYDMSGNVWEWCSDWYDQEYYNQEVKINPQGANTGDSKIIRGGSWDDTNEYCALAKKISASLETQWTTIGFRIVLEEE
ncbi:MAG TPA: SUMF1/EgtB/PvdO family nonheme iron enzyme [Brumimicrobium sp.]|nr:SUMF1/EgtB/PvdO family nonheme iron enzyme [Brumimicrobium sp.]